MTKLPKTRIKIEYSHNGDPRYKPQYKKWGFWHFFPQKGENSCFAEWFTSLFGARKYIDEFLAKQQTKLVLGDYVIYPNPDNKLELKKD